MNFTNFQISVILISFILTILIAFFWYKNDKKDSKKEEVEHLWVLISVFFWSAFLALWLKLSIDFLVNIEYFLVYKSYFEYITIWAEEVVKAVSIIVWLEIAGKRFDEISDWFIYWVFAILWFMFFENIFYILVYSSKFWSNSDLVSFIISRNLFPFFIHLSTIFFSIFYATAYLRTKNKENLSRPAPWHILSQIKLLWKWLFLKWFLLFLLSPFILLINIFKKYNPRFWIVIFWSFFMSIFLHILFNHLIWLWIEYLMMWISFFWILAVIIFRRFNKLSL